MMNDRKWDVTQALGYFQVSWVRRKDYHLLTVALTQYSSDERFSVRHLKTSEVSKTPIFGHSADDWYIFF